MFNKSQRIVDLHIRLLHLYQPEHPLLGRPQSQPNETKYLKAVRG